MSLQTGTIGIIADDLTGANDTALQFHLRGCNTQILFDYMELPQGKANTQAWAISSETRHKNPDEAANIVGNIAKVLANNFNAEYFFKKIDSTLRGNIAKESLGVLEALNWDAAIITPAFPAESRITVGGYHLLKGIPIERTEVARDLLSPIYQSHLPTLLSQQVDNPEIIAHIQLMTVMKGAGPILMELHELIKKKKKLIIIDAVSTTDLEQIALATEKSNFMILPCGSAGLAQTIAKFWLPELKHQHIAKTIPTLPILLVSGSATAITRSQVTKLIESDEFEPYVVELSPAQIMSSPSEELIERVVKHLGTNGIVLVYSAPLDGNLDKTIEHAAGLGIEKDCIPGLVGDYLAALTREVVDRHNVILTLVGGETAYRCCSAIDSKHLQLIDEVEPAIPLCLDHKAQWIVTKSGNLGTPNTLINILKYFKKHQ